MTAEQGTLFLCATPIGNLEDITCRALRVLKEAAVIAAEDTRHTRKLLNYFDIRTPLVSYHEHNKQECGPKLIARLLQGETVAVVSDAGMPGISDPGADLVRLAIEAGVRVEPVPGPNAALAALVCSGLDTSRFTFVGFLPKTGKKRQELLASLSNHPYSLIFYESPHRLKDTLNDLENAFGDRQAVAARELTKKFEEFVRGTLGSLKQHFNRTEARGEFTLIVAGCPQQSVQQDDQAGTGLADAVQALVETGINKKEAIQRIASDRKLPRRVVYQAVIGRDE